MGAIFGALAILGIIVFLVHCLRARARDKRLVLAMQRTPTYEISDLGRAANLAGSLVEITGRIVPHDVIEGPFSSRACVYCQARVKEHSGRNYLTTLDRTQAVPFSIDDGTGTVLVVPAGAEVFLDRDTRLCTGRTLINESTPPRVEAYLHRHGKTSRDWLSLNKAMLYEEVILEPGDTVYVLGTAVRQSDGAVQIRASQGNPFVISDKEELRLTGWLRWRWLTADLSESRNVVPPPGDGGA